MSIIIFIEVLSPFLYIDSFVQASVDPDLDHAGDEVSSNAHQEKRSTRSSKKTSILSEGKLSMIFVFFIQSLPVVNNFFFTIDTNSGHDNSTLEPEDNTNPPQKRDLRKRATTAGMLSTKSIYSAINITLTNVFL